jgi:two-component system, OmpR family, response regulator RstA
MLQSPEPLALIIEDDDKLATIFQQAMKMAGFSIRVIKNGLEAIEAVSVIVPAIVILDLNLPGANGDKVLAVIRKDERLAKTIVILATSDSLMADYLRDQCDYVLLKPVSFGQLQNLGTRLRNTVH